MAPDRRPEFLALMTQEVASASSASSRSSWSSPGSTPAPFRWSVARRPGRHRLGDRRVPPPALRTRGWPSTAPRRPRRPVSSPPTPPASSRSCSSSSTTPSATPRQAGGSARRRSTTGTSRLRSPTPARHPGRRTALPLRPLLPGRPVAGGAGPRPRPRDRPGARRRPRRVDRGALRAARGERVHRASATRR